MHPFRVALNLVDTETFLDSSRPREVLPPETDKRAYGHDGIPTNWQPGDVILDRYEVKELLGRGGMGRVHRVFHRGWGIDLAVKSPVSALGSDSRYIRTFLRESETWVNLGLHAHVVTCYYARPLGGLPRMFAEFVDAGSLDQWISDGRLYKGDEESENRSLIRILAIAIQAAWGLQHAHEQGLVHRDVKPANILLTSDGIAKVTDFGLAKARAQADRLSGVEPPPALRPDSQSSHPSSAGMTPVYCSPEQALFRKLTPATDVWSWALCILHMLNGGVTWRVGPDAVSAVRDYRAQCSSAQKGDAGERTPARGGSGFVVAPPKMLDLLTHCCKEDPTARPESMLEAASVLEEVFREVSGRDFARRYPQSVDHRAESINNRAVSLLDLGNPVEAERQWQLALQVAPRHIESTYNVELLRWRSARITDVDLIETIHDLSEQHPGNRLPDQLLAGIHMERGDYGATLRLSEALMKAGLGTIPPHLLRELEAQAEGSRRVLAAFEGHRDIINSVCLGREKQGRTNQENSESGSVEGTVFQPRHALSGSRDNTLKLWDLKTGKCVRTLEGHTRSIRAVQLAECDRGTFLRTAPSSSSRKRKEIIAISAGDDKTVKFWEAASGHCLRTLQHDAEATAVALSEDLQHVVVGLSSGVIRLWAVLRNEPVGRLQGHTRDITALHLDQSARRVVSSSLDGTFRIWNLDTLKCTVACKAHEGGTTTVRMYENHLLTGGMDGRVKLWDLETKQSIRILQGHNGPVMSAALTRDKRHIVSTSTDGTVRVWDVVSKRCLCTLEGHGGDIRCADISEDSRFLITGNADGSIQLWSLGTHMAQRPTSLVLCRALRSDAAASTDSTFNRYLEEARCCIDSGNPTAAADTIKRARALPGYLRKAEAIQEHTRLYSILPKVTLSGSWLGTRLRGHLARITALDTARDGQTLLVGCADGMLSLWNLPHARVQRVFHGHIGSVKRAVISPRGRFAVSAGDDSTIRLWDCATGTLIRDFAGHVGSVEGISLSPDGHYALTGALDVRLWELSTGRCLMAYPGHTEDVTSVCWTPDGEYVLVGSSEGAIRMLHAATGDEIGVLEGPEGPVRSISVSGDGLMAISGGGHPWNTEAHAALWNMETGRLQGLLHGHKGPLNIVDLSIDGRFALSCSTDGTARIWEVGGQRCLQTLRASNESVEAACFTQDGRHVLAGTKEGDIAVWVLDWELDVERPVNWRERTVPFLVVFALLHMLPEGAIPLDRLPSPPQVKAALTRTGQPTWDEQDLERLFYDLGCAGLGLVSRAEILNELDGLLD